jgi:hypothetical protein
LISESSNTILTQIYDTVVQGLQIRPNITKLSFIFDNHSTQKSYVMIAFFEWLLLQVHQPITIDIIFYVAGHSHNRLDQRNSDPQRSFFSKSRIESIPEYVCIVFL